MPLLNALSESLLNKNAVNTVNPNQVKEQSRRWITGTVLNPNQN